jgi:hypothetical protein
MNGVDLTSSQRDTIGDEALFYLLFVASSFAAAIAAAVDYKFIPGLTPIQTGAAVVIGSSAIVALWLRQPPVVIVKELSADGVALGVGVPATRRVLAVSYSRAVANLSRGFFRARAIWGRSATNPTNGVMVYLTIDGVDRPHTVAVAFRTPADATAFGTAAAKLIRSGEGPYRT